MKWVGKWLPLLRFGGSRSYWEARYRLGGDSGAGSEGAAAAYKALVLNEIVRANSISSVIEFGCGDGRQLALADYPDYVGVDVSADAVRICRRVFEKDANKRFMTLDEYAGEQAQLALSLDVLFHLVEDAVYDTYLDRLFAAGAEFVVIYSTSVEELVPTLPHVRHRNVERDVSGRFPQFARLLQLERELPPPVEAGNGGMTRFFVYRRR